MSYKKFVEIVSINKKNQSYEPVYKFINSGLENSINDESRFSIALSYRPYEPTYRHGHIDQFPVEQIVNTNYIPLFNLDEEDINYLCNKYSFLLDDNNKREYERLNELKNFYRETIEQNKESIRELDETIKKIQDE
ncbi:MAG TPA: hypothetical protein VF680_16925 [Allosphingosinicella sp.]|jgi:hypothetical protein